MQSLDFVRVTTFSEWNWKGFQTNGYVAHSFTVHPHRRICEVISSFDGFGHNKFVLIKFCQSWPCHRSWHSLWWTLLVGRKQGKLRSAHRKGVPYPVIIGPDHQIDPKYYFFCMCTSFVKSSMKKLPATIRKARRYEDNNLSHLELKATLRKKGRRWFK